MRHLSLLTCLLLLALLPGQPAAPAAAQTGDRCFPETGQCISGPIRAYWEANGGLASIGYPITPLRLARAEGWSGPVQWFERDRLEDHSAQGLGIMAGRLGVERLAQLGRPWRQRPLPAAPADCLAFPQTGYAVCGQLRAYWEANGGLERFGYPITDLASERVGGAERQVQYFERRRMELHPEQRPPYTIQLGLLGSELLAGAPPALRPTPAPSPAPAPSPTPAVRQQILIDFPTDEIAVRSPFTLSGRTARAPGGGRLSYWVEDDHHERLAEGSFPVTPRPGGGGDFMAEISFRPPVGPKILLELRDVDPATGQVQATARHSFTYSGPPRAGQIVIESPRQGEFVGVDFSVRGHATYMPGGSDLFVRVRDASGGEIGLTRIVLSAPSGAAPRFELALSLPGQGGRQVTVEVQDRDGSGDVLSQASVQVYIAAQCP